MFVVELEWLRLERYQHVLVVLVVEGQWLLDELAILNELLQIDLGLSDHVVTLEEVAVIRLHRELVVCSRDVQLVNKSVLEIGLAVLVPVMRIGLLNIFLGIKEASEEHVTCALPIHDLHFLGVEDTNTQLKCLQRLLCDIIRFDVLWVDVYRIDFDPTSNDTLLL